MKKSGCASHLTNLKGCYYACFGFSPDRSEKPFESKAYFFLGLPKRPAEALGKPRKKGFAEKACSEERE